jgi:hypothetical protein
MTMIIEHATISARTAGLDEALAFSRQTGIRRFERRVDAAGRLVFTEISGAAAAPSRAAAATSSRRARLRVVEAELRLDRARRLERLERELAGNRR